MNKNKILLFLPLLILFSLCLLLFTGLQQNPNNIASALIGKPVPEFQLANLLNKQQSLTNRNLPKQWYLLNVWASWCSSCQAEFAFLLQLKQQTIPIVGLNYRDKTQNAIDTLTKLGNPFILNLDDSKGTLALNLGVDGAPETYLIDENGIIRYRYSGQLDHNIWQTEFLTTIKNLAK